MTFYDHAGDRVEARDVLDDDELAEYAVQQLLRRPPQVSTWSAPEYDPANYTNPRTYEGTE